MTEWFAVETWIALWDQVATWFVANVLIVDTAIQLAIVLVAFAVAYFASRKIRPRLLSYHAPSGVGRVVRALIPLLLALIWLFIQWLSIAAVDSFGWNSRLLAIVTSLLSAWIVIRFASQLVTRPIWATMITWIAWSIAALSILNLLDPVMALLDSAAITIGNFSISLLTIVQSTLALAVLISLAIYFSTLIESRIRSSKVLSPSVQVLLAKSLKIVLLGLAVLISLRTVGIDLTALAVFGGAIGLGVGFGLQKIVSNLVSGIILLIDKSIKPGDVIAVSGTYGWVTALGGRYVSVVTRDGVEHLIPNEMLISERVENWTHSNSYTRLKIDFGVHYKSDVHQVIALSIAAGREIERVLNDPEPKCLLMEFGDNSINFQLRVWIADAHNGVQNIKSAVLLKLWDTFQEHGIEIPYPQRDVHIIPPANLQ